IFPERTTAGPVRVAAFYNGRTRDSSSFAVLHDQTGKFIMDCPLRNNGTAVFDLPVGGSVTIAGAQTNVTCTVPACQVNCTYTEDTCNFCHFGDTCSSNDSAIRTLETVAATKQYDVLTIGSTQPRDQFLGSVNVSVATDFPNATSYTASNGCGSGFQFSPDS